MCHKYKVCQLLAKETLHFKLAAIVQELVFLTQQDHTNSYYSNCLLTIVPVTINSDKIDYHARDITACILLKYNFRSQNIVV